MAEKNDPPGNLLGGLALSGLGGSGMLIGRQMIKDAKLRSELRRTHGFDVIGPSKLAERGPLSIVRGRTGGLLTMAGGALLTAAGIEMIAPGSIRSKANAAEPAKAPSPAPASPAPATPSAPALATAAEVLARSNPVTHAALTMARDPGKAVDAAGVALTTTATVQAARILTNPAVRAGAGMLSKAFVPLTAALALYDGVQGYKKDGIKGAAMGVADSLTGGGVSFLRDHLMSPSAPAAPPVAPPGLVSDRLAVAQGAAQRTAAEMGQVTTMGSGSMRPATAEVQSDGETEGYVRMQNGRRVTVAGYKTPTR